MLSVNAWGETPPEQVSTSFDLFCNETEKVLMRFDRNVYQYEEEEYDTLRITGNCKICEANYGKGRDWEVELQNSDSLSTKHKFKCIYQPAFSRMNCPQPFGKLLVIKTNTLDFILVNPIITSSSNLSQTSLSKGSCINFKS